MSKVFFQTKRQRREKVLRRWGDETWGDLPRFLQPPKKYVQGGVGILVAVLPEPISDPAERLKQIKKWLDKAEKKQNFGVELDRYLELPTESEDAEKHSYHRRLLLVAGFVLAVFVAVFAVVTRKW